MKVITQIALCVSFSWTAVFAQSMDRPKLAASSEDHSSRGYKVNWRVDPFDQKSFIENLGQFDTVLTNTTKVWYGAALGDVTAYFTSNGIVYRYDQPLDQKAAGEKENEDVDKINFRKRKTHYLKIEWEGSNPYAKIDASEKRPDYYVYPTGLTSSLQAGLFKKITYRDMYPGIDVEYIFPEGKEGLKYAIIAHPGSDISKVKLKYIGAKSISKNKEGNVIIRTEMGDFTDHAPVSFYDGESNKKIQTTTNLQGSIESFSVPDFYDRNKTLVIDPWVTNPFGYGGKRGPWDIDYDYSGNVYAASGRGLVKFNSAGTIVWTYTISGITYCDFTVDRVTGTSYVVGLGGYTGVIQKVSTTGGLVATASTANNKAWEFWRAVWNPCTNQIVIGAGGTNGDGSTGTNTNQGAITDLNLSAITIRNVMGVAGSNYDMVGVAVDPSGTSCYMANVNWSVANNKLIKLPLPAFTPTIFNVANGYLFQETSHNFYAGGLGGWYHGMNVMTAGNNGVYMWDGYTLKQFNKTTGALITSNIVQPPYVISGIVKSFWAGIDVDVCEKIYAGYKTSVKVFNSSLTQINSIPMSNNLDTVNDVAIGNKGKTLYACGTGFVTSIDVAGPATDTITKVTTQATCLCNGTAATTLNRCGSPLTSGVTYLWSNGQTTQTATGLCAGVHNVTLTYNCVPYPDTVKITSPSGLVITQAQTNVQCYGGNTGSSSVNITGGISPYTYSWSPAGGSTNNAGGLTAGTYTVSVTDAAGCKITSIVNITQPNPPVTGSSSTNNSCTTTGSASVSVGANGPYSYTWSNGASGPTAYGLIAGNYTITVSDVNGCTQTKTFIITGTNPVSAAFTQSQINACTNTVVNFTHTGTTGTHAWSISPLFVSGSTTNFSYTFLSAGTYSVTHTVTNAGCTATVTSNVYVTNCSAGPAVTATGSSACPGACAAVTSSGTGGTSPYTYSWSNGATTQNISPCPAATTTYTVTIRDAGGNTSTSTAVVTINPAVNVTTIATNISCNGGTDGSASATGGSGTSPYAYIWSNGQTTSTSTGLTSGNYSVTITDSKGCTATSTTSLASPPPFVGQFTKGTANCASCGCKEWIMVTGTGGTSPYSYSWPDSYVNRYKNQLCPGAYTIKVVDKNGCSTNLTVSTP